MDNQIHEIKAIPMSYTLYKGQLKFEHLLWYYKESIRDIEKNIGKLLQDIDLNGDFNNSMASSKNYII